MQGRFIMNSRAVFHVKRFTKQSSIVGTVVVRLVVYGCEYYKSGLGLNCRLLIDRVVALVRYLPRPL